MIEGDSIIPMRRCLVSVAFTLCVVHPGGVAQAAARRSSHPACFAVQATGVGQDLGGGQTGATISSHGVILGHTHATFTPTGMAGSTESFTGSIVFRSRAGTLTAQVAGTFHTTGHFRATSSSVTGTGLLRRVTGKLTLSGIESLTTGSFSETITGVLCVGGRGQRTHSAILSRRC